MRNYIKYLRFNHLQFALMVLVSLLTLYIGSKEFRNLISVNGIDPVIITGFISAFTLLLAFFQSAKERRFSYKMLVASKFEEMAHIVIAKLLEVESKRYLFLGTVQSILECMKSGRMFKDGNNIKSAESFNRTVSDTVAALDIYFPDEGPKWNEVVDALSKMGTIVSTVLVNYDENGIKLLAGPEREAYVETVTSQLQELQEINQGLGNKPLEIREEIIKKVNKFKMKLADA